MDQLYLNDDLINEEARQIQKALAAHGIGEDQITLAQICLAVKGQHMLWDHAGEKAEHQMKVERREHLTLITPEDT